MSDSAGLHVIAEQVEGFPLGDIVQGWKSTAAHLINRQLGRYLAITPEAIQAAASEVFRTENRIALTYLPTPPGESATAAEANA